MVAAALPVATLRLPRVSMVFAASPSGITPTVPEEDNTYIFDEARHGVALKGLPERYIKQKALDEVS